MESELFVLAGIVAIAVWILVTVWRYIDIQSRKSFEEQEREMFGSTLDWANRERMFNVIPRFDSPRSFFIFLLVAAFMGVAMLLGYL